jgi:3-oxoacyl-[acyl-carrier protein] reductase
VDLELGGKVAVVLGADRGIGAASARALEAEGCRLVGPAQLAEADIVVAHGGGRTDGRFLAGEGVEELHAAWDAVVQAVDAYHAALPHMSAQRWGRVVWVGSARAKSLDASADDDLDAMVSLAMMSVHKMVTHESGPTNVTANTVLVGGDATDEDAAATVAFLCSAGAGYLSGVTITVDGGVGSAVF